MVDNVNKVQEALKDLKRDVEDGECEKHRLLTIIADLARDLVVQECESVSLGLQKDRLSEQISKIQQLHSEMSSSIQKQIQEMHFLYNDKEKVLKQLSIEMADREDELTFWTQRSTEINLQIAEKHCEINFLDNKLAEISSEQHLLTKLQEADRLVKLKTDLYINYQRDSIEQQARLKGFQIKADYLDGKILFKIRTNESFWRKYEYNFTNNG